jgi:uncharacterized protein
MKRTLTTTLFAASALIAACVTINIYFPAAAAEKAADRIIQDVWGDTSTAPGSPSSQQIPNDRPNAVHSQAHPDVGLLQAQSLSFFLSSAWAADPDLTVSSPAIDKLTASMKARHNMLEPYYQSGAIGLTNSALVTVRIQQAIPLSQRNTVKQLVADENSDREALYRELARANGHPEWEGNIRDIFATRWVANAPTGWWYQKSDDVWTQKK